MHLLLLDLTIIIMHFFSILQAVDTNNDASGELILEGLDMDGNLVRLSCDLDTHGNSAPGASLGKYSFRMHELYFQPTLDPVRFISVLNDLQSIKIEFDGVGQLDTVQLGTAVDAISGFDERPIANHVETCEAANRMTKGDECSDWYTFGSDSNNPYQDCKACNCNKHSRVPCDRVSGKCKCEHNTCGDHCQTCCSGFYGEPHLGTANDCEPCPCPGNGACTLTASGLAPTNLDEIAVTCVDCPEGSRGARCETCDENYFGDPLGLDGLGVRTCQECNCNGNTNKHHSGNCNTSNGKCLQCLYNTSGDNCEQCLPGFYGNPELLAHQQAHGKGCVKCECSKKGSVDDICDEETGQCKCLPGVTGLNCDQCEVQHYGLTEGIGCQRCDCDPIGSINGECDLFDGTCECKSHVSGRQCDQCELDHYGFSADGCLPCNCDQSGSTSQQCDIFTGQCDCRDGVMGMQCDQCKENYFYNRTEVQCQKCPQCYDLVEYQVNRHRQELKRLVTLKDEIVSNPTQFVDDREFERELVNLNSNSASIANDAKRVLREFEIFTETLEDNGSNLDQVSLQLSQFASSLETCERTVSQSRVYQMATVGTIRVIDSLLNEIGYNMQEASDELVTAESYAIAQKNRHQELRSLYSQAADAQQRHQDESEKVQLAAQAALETSKRAKEQILKSITTIKSLKQKLEQVSNNDVPSTRSRLINLKRISSIALENAKKASNRALDLKIPDEIPKFDAENVRSSAEDIEQAANSINDRLNVLRERMVEHKLRYEKDYISSQELYEEGSILQKQADLLMAQVHAAKLDVTTSNSRINDIFKKAKTVIEMIKNAHENLPKLAGPIDPSVNIDQLRQDINKLRDEMDPLVSEVENAATLSKVRLENTKSVLEEAQTTDSANADTLDNLIQFKIDVETAVNDASTKKHSFEDGESSLDDKIKHVNTLRASSETKKDLADKAVNEMNAADEYLMTIQDFIREIKDRNLLQLAKTFNESVKDEDDVINDATEKYEKLRERFDSFVKLNKAQLENFKKSISEQEVKRADYEKSRLKLSKEVSNLEDIKNTLPQWCTKDPNINEAANHGRRNPSRRSDISERT